MSTTTGSIRMSKRKTLFLPPQPFLVECPTFIFRFAWFIIVFLHLAHAGSLSVAMYSQFRTIRSPDEVDATFRSVGRRFHVHFYVIAIAVELAFTSYHIYAVSFLVWHSIRARELTLVNPDPLSRSFLTASWETLSATFEKHFSNLATAMSRWMYLYGIRGPFFERAFHAKELYETLWECLQMYRNLYHVIHPSVGYLATFVVVLNCWATPVIYWCFPCTNHRATRLVLCLAVDAVLDLISSVMLPFAVYVNYRQLFHDPHTYDPVWMFIAGTDLIQFAPMGFSAILSRLFPSTSMVANLFAIKPVLKRIRKDAALVRIPSLALVVPTAPPVGLVHPNAAVVAPAAPPSVVLTTPLRPRHPRWINALHFVLFSIGLTSILLSVVGNRDPIAEGVPHCRVVMRHWLVPRLPCAVLEIDCTADRISGFNQSELVDRLELVDERALRALTFCNCPHLVIPSAIRTLPNLNWLEVRNSTLVDWPRTAALTHHTTPRLGRLLFLDANFTAFPAALTDVDDFPVTLLDIVFSTTNLSDLPSNLHASWPSRMATVVFESCQFTHVPSTLASMQTDVLSLAGNRISEVPRSLLEGKTFILLSLAHNPIKELPEQLMQPLTLLTTLSETKAHGLWLAGTNVSSLPPWLVSTTSTSTTSSCQSLVSPVYGHDTPLCDEEPLKAAATGCPVNNPRQLHCDPSTAPVFAISRDGFLIDAAFLTQKPPGDDKGPPPPR